jgi:hypothetical protein
MKSFLFIIALVCSSAIAFSQAPAWYTTHAHGSYQPAQYLLGAGSADGANAIEKAKKNAQVDIVSQIKVQVKGEMKNVSTSFQLDKNETISSDFSSRSRTAVNEEITGIEIVETYVDPSTQTAYALAALDRQKYARSLSDEMNAAWTQSSDLRAAADEFLKRGKVQDALRSCADARMLIVAALPKKALHDAVAGKAYTAPNPITPVSLTADMQAMLSNMKIEKVSGDKQTGKIGSRFGVPMKVRVTYKNTVVANAPVRFETTDKTQLSETMTDEQGEAEFRGCVRSIPGSAIRVRPVLGNLEREFEQSSQGASALFSYTPQPSEIALELAVTGVKGKAAENVKSALASAVGKTGYRIVPSSRYRLEAALQAKPAAKTEGLNGTLYMVQVEAVSTLTDVQTHASLGSVASTATAGGKSESEATEKASAKLAIDRMKLAELIEKIGQ